MEVIAVDNETAGDKECPLAAASHHTPYEELNLQWIYKQNQRLEPMIFPHLQQDKVCNGSSQCTG